MKINSFVLVLVFCFSTLVFSSTQNSNKARLKCSDINLEGFWKVEFYTDSVESVRLTLDIDDDQAVPMTRLFSNLDFGIKIFRENDKLRIYTNTQDETSGSSMYISIGDNIRQSPESTSTLCSFEISGHKVINGKKIPVNEYFFVLASARNLNDLWFGGKQNIGDADFSIDQSMSAIGYLEKI